MSEGPLMDDHAGYLTPPSHQPDWDNAEGYWDRLDDADRDPIDIPMTPPRSGIPRPSSPPPRPEKSKRVRVIANGTVVGTRLVFPSLDDDDDDAHGAAVPTTTSIVTGIILLACPLTRPCPVVTGTTTTTMMLEETETETMEEAAALRTSPTRSPSPPAPCDKANLTTTGEEDDRTGDTEVVEDEDVLVPLPSSPDHPPPPPPPPRQHQHRRRRPRDSPDTTSPPPPPPSLRNRKLETLLAEERAWRRHVGQVNDETRQLTFRRFRDTRDRLALETRLRDRRVMEWTKDQMRIHRYKSVQLTLDHPLFPLDSPLLGLANAP